jgi:Asp-tRNA(Asn)/Glu-tRNA(Gln) amidotransferase A subunit family amidase
VPTRTGEPTATELLEQLRRREVSSRELAELYLARIGEVDGPLNAVAHVEPERTLAAADDADRRLAAGETGALLGLPLSVKDSIAVAGMPCRSGSCARADNVPDADATVVTRVRAAGAVVLCKTTTPEYTWSTETDSALTGRTNNPYDVDRTPGGSSGGEAALHAVDASPLGIGSDGLCSIRVPAHFCGTVGLRPTVGLVPETGVWPTTKDTGMLDMSTLGPMGRSVQDLGLLLRAIAGPDDVDPLVAAVSVGDPAAVDVGALRVGFYETDADVPATPGTRAAVRGAAQALAALGAEVEEAQAPPLGDALDLAFGMMAADGGLRAREDLAPAGGRHVAQMTALLEGLAPLALSAGAFFDLVRRWAERRSALRRFVAGYDVVLCPVVAGPAPLHGRRPSDDGELTDLGEYVYAFAYAIAGVPAAVVPAGTERGLPVGVQVLAPAYRDHVALGAAAALEPALRDALPRPPGVDAAARMPA